MHGLDVDVRSLAARHRGDGVPPRSRRREVHARGPRAAVPLDRADVARRRGGHARPRRRRRRRRDRPPRRDRAPARRRARARRCGARELVDLYERIELPLVRGARARWRTRASASTSSSSTQLGKELGDAVPRSSRREIHAHAGEQFNVNSTPQLRRVLFEKLGLTPVKKTKTGPVDRRRLAAEDGRGPPDRRDLLRYREVEKLRSTYADALPPLVGDDGRIHATFNQTRRPPPAASRARRRTSRTSRCAPPTGASCRTAFIADDGCGLLTADYSQIELRVLAHLAEDPGPHRGVRARLRHPHHHRGQGLRRRRGEGRRVPAPLRQGRELRARVRDGGVRPRAAARHPDRPGARDPRRVLRGVPERRGLHEGDGARGEGVAATRPRSSAGAASSPSCRPTTSASARWGSAWRRTRRCRAPRPTSSSSR